MNWIDFEFGLFVGIGIFIIATIIFLKINDKVKKEYLKYEGELNSM